MLSGSAWAGRGDRAFASAEHPQQRRLPEWTDGGMRSRTEWEDKRARCRAEFATRIPVRAAEIASEISAAVASEVNAAVAAALDAAFARQREALLDAVIAMDRARASSSTTPTSSPSDMHAPAAALARTSPSVQVALAAPTTCSTNCPSHDTASSVSSTTPTSCTTTVDIVPVLAGAVISGEALEVDVADVAAPTHTTCSTGYPSCGAFEESALTSPAAPPSSTTVGSVTPEPAAPEASPMLPRWLFPVLGLDNLAPSRCSTKVKVTPTVTSQFTQGTDNTVDLRPLPWPSFACIPVWMLVQLEEFGSLVMIASAGITVPQSVGESSTIMMYTARWLLQIPSNSVLQGLPSGSSAKNFIQMFSAAMNSWNYSLPSAKPGMLTRYNFFCAWNSSGTGLLHDGYNQVWFSFLITGPLVQCTFELNQRKIVWILDWDSSKTAGVKFKELLLTSSVVINYCISGTAWYLSFTRFRPTNTYFVEHELQILGERRSLLINSDDVVYAPFDVVIGSLCCELQSKEILVERAYLHLIAEVRLEAMRSFFVSERGAPATADSIQVIASLLHSEDVFPTTIRPIAVSTVQFVLLFNVRPLPWPWFLDGRHVVDEILLLPCSLFSCFPQGGCQKHPWPPPQMLLLICNLSDWDSFEIKLVLDDHWPAWDRPSFTRHFIQRAYELMPWNSLSLFSCPLLGDWLLLCSTQEAFLSSSEKFQWENAGLLDLALVEWKPWTSGIYSWAIYLSGFAGGPDVPIFLWLQFAIHSSLSFQEVFYSSIKIRKLHFLLGIYSRSIHYFEIHILIMGIYSVTAVVSRLLILAVMWNEAVLWPIFQFATGAPVHYQLSCNLVVKTLLKWMVALVEFQPWPSGDISLFFLPAVLASFDNCQGIMVPPRILREGTTWMHYLSKLYKQQYSSSNRLLFEHCTYYDFACFAWKIAWVLLGTGYACSDLEGSEHVTSKSRPPDILLQDWLSCLMGRIIQCGFHLLQWKTAWSLFWECFEITSMNSKELLLLQVGEIFPANFIAVGVAPWYMLCSRPRPTENFSVHHKARSKGHDNIFGDYKRATRATNVDPIFLYINLVHIGRNYCFDYACCFDNVRADNDYYIGVFLEQVDAICYLNLIKVCLDYDSHHDFNEVLKQVLWDPGGSIRHWLEVKPKFKDGGMLATSPSATTGLHLGHGLLAWAAQKQRTEPTTNTQGMDTSELAWIRMASASLLLFFFL